jgi:actin-related protein
MYLLVNDIKEKACTASLDYCADLKLAKETEFLKLQCAHLPPAIFLPCDVLGRYVLPSGGGSARFGSVRPASAPASKDDQILNLCNERISTAELLFHPSDIGLRQMGIAETIADIVNKLEPSMAAACLRNIVCCGGTTNIPNFSQRLMQVLVSRPFHRHFRAQTARRMSARWCHKRTRSMSFRWIILPVQRVSRVFCRLRCAAVCAHDAACAGLGGAELAQSATMQQIVVSRAE